MSLYAIILHHPSTEVWDKIRATWPKHHILDDRVAFINVDNAQALTQEISDQAGIGAENDISGLVVQMDYFAGRTNGALVEWINKNRG